MLFKGWKGLIFRLLLLGVFSFFLCLLGAGKMISAQPISSGGNNLPEGLEEGMLAPDFTLHDLSGNEVRLSQCRGKGVILNFWSTWCKPCRAELPLIESFYQTNGNEVEVLSVSINRERDNTVKDFAQAIGLSFPVLLDYQKKVARQYKIFAVPTSFILDKRGVIVKKVFGEIEVHPEQLLSMINGTKAIP